MSDYIKREDAIQAIVGHLVPKQYDGNLVNAGFEVAHEIVDALPSADVVEVVRCKDCKYWKPYTSQYGTGQFCECPCSFGGQGIKKPDDYCSYGERRDDREYNNSILNARKGEE